jgi:hypothetical protein
MGRQHPQDEPADDRESPSPEVTRKTNPALAQTALNAQSCRIAQERQGTASSTNIEYLESHAATVLPYAAVE